MIMHAFCKPEASRNRYSGRLMQGDRKERAGGKERKEWRTRKKRKGQSKVKTLWKGRLPENQSFPSVLTIQSHQMCVPSLLSTSLPFFSDPLTPWIYLGPHVTCIQWGLQCPSQAQIFLHLPNCTLNFHTIASIIFLQSLWGFAQLEFYHPEWWFFLASRTVHLHNFIQLLDIKTVGYIK